jgi:hypothetical protein
MSIMRPQPYAKESAIVKPRLCLDYLADRLMHSVVESVINNNVRGLSQMWNGRLEYPTYLGVNIWSVIEYKIKAPPRRFGGLLDTLRSGAFDQFEPAVIMWKSWIDMTHWIESDDLSDTIIFHRCSHNSGRAAEIGPDL